MSLCPGPRLALAGLLAAALSGLAGCAVETLTAGRPVVLTQVPAAAFESQQAVLGPQPGERYPVGSRLVLADLDDPAAAPRLLSEGLAAAGGGSLSHDARRLVFVGREEAGAPFAVFTAAADGSGWAKAADPGSDCGGAAFLPDGRIVFSARVAGPPPLPGLGSAWALFVAEEGGEPRRITFGGAEIDPSVLADGRIVHARFQPGGDGRPEGGSLSLFTVHPDGTGAAPFHGQHEGPVWKLRPRQAPGGDVVYLAVGPGGGAAVRRADWRSPAGPGARVEIEGEGPFDPLFAEPTAEGLLVAAAGPGGGLLRAGPDGRVSERWAVGDPDWRVVHAVEAAPRPRPQGHLSMVDPEGERGQLLCLDARPAGAPEAARVRLRRAPRDTPWAPSGCREDGAQPGDCDPGEVLGEVELASDGSFFAVVPADVPLLLEVLDAEGRLLEGTSTPVWVRPKEVRGCVGCHEHPETAPPNRRPLAVLEEPADLTAPPQDPPVEAREGASVVRGAARTERNPTPEGGAQRLSTARSGPRTAVPTSVEVGR